MFCGDNFDDTLKSWGYLNKIHIPLTKKEYYGIHDRVPAVSLVSQKELNLQ
jgi:hypothetical protein